MEKWTINVLNSPHERGELAEPATEQIAQIVHLPLVAESIACDARRAPYVRTLGGEVRRRGGLVAAVAAVLVTALTTRLAADEQSTPMWGAGGQDASASAEFLASNEMHVSNGRAAGQVNAALDRLLYEGVSISVTSVGSQNVINTTVYGDRNQVEVEADQESSNSGDVSNGGTINIQRGVLED